MKRQPETTTPPARPPTASTIYGLLHTASPNFTSNLHLQFENLKNDQLYKTNDNDNATVNSNNNNIIDGQVTMNVNEIGTTSTPANTAVTNASGSRLADNNEGNSNINNSTDNNNINHTSSTVGSHSTTTTTKNVTHFSKNINISKSLTSTPTATPTPTLPVQNNTNQLGSHVNYTMNTSENIHQPTNTFNNTINFNHFQNYGNNAILQQQNYNSNNHFQYISTIPSQQQQHHNHIAIQHQQLPLHSQQLQQQTNSNNDLLRKYNNSSPILNLLNESTTTTSDSNNVIKSQDKHLERNNSITTTNSSTSTSATSKFINITNGNKFKHKLPLLNRSKSALPTLNNDNNNPTISTENTNTNTGMVNMAVSLSANNTLKSDTGNSNNNNNDEKLNTKTTTLLAKRSYSQLENTKKDINLKKSILSRRNTQEMIAKTIANKHINEPIDNYAKIVKDSELKLMSMDNKSFSKSTIQSAEQKKEHERQIFALIWLMQNCESKHDSYVPRGRIFAQYASICAHFKLKPLSQASLGKLIRTVFPDLTTRRLGMRGQSKYHYCGLKLINDHDSDSTSTNKGGDLDKINIHLVDQNNKNNKNNKNDTTVLTNIETNEIDTSDTSELNNEKNINDKINHIEPTETASDENNLNGNNIGNIGTMNIISGGKIAKSGKLNKTLKKIKLQRGDTIIDENFDRPTASNDESSISNGNTINTKAKSPIEKFVPKEAGNNNSNNNDDNKLYFLDNILVKVFDNSEINLTTYKLDLPKIPVDNILAMDSIKFDKDIIISLESIYMIYCNTIFENVKYFKFDQLPKNLSLFESNAISPQMYDLFTSEELYPWILKCDTITHIAIIKFLSHLVINHNSVTDSIFFKLENFINNYSDQILVATKGLPTKLANEKLELSKSFTTVLKKLLLLLKFIMSFLKSAESFKDGMNKDWKTIVNLNDIFDLVTTNSAYQDIMKCLKSHILNQTTTFLNDEGPNSLNNVIFSLLQFASSAKEPANTIMDCYVRFTNALIGDISLKSSENLLPWLFFNNITVQLLNYSLEVTKFVS